MNSSAKISLLHANLSDIPALIEVGRLTFLETFADGNDAADMEAYVAEAFSVDRVSSELENPDSAFFLLRSDDKVAGYLKLNTGDAQTEKRGSMTLEIERIYLLSAFHGQGLGKIMMDHAIETAVSNGMKSVWLGVWEKNPNAIAFYERKGFRIVGEHVFTIGSDKQRDYIMERDL